MPVSGLPHPSPVNERVAVMLLTRTGLWCVALLVIYIVWTVYVVRSVK